MARKSHTRGSIMGERKKTRDVLPELGVPYHRLFGMLRSGKLDPLPLKDSAGDYWWSEADVARAREALANDRRRKPVTTTAAAEAVALTV